MDDDHSALKGKDAWPPAMMVTDPEVVMLGDVAQTQKDMCWVTPLRGGTERGQTHRQRVEGGAGARGAGLGEWVLLRVESRWGKVDGARCWRSHHNANVLNVPELDTGHC